MSPSVPLLFRFLTWYTTISTKKTNITPTTANAVETELPGLVLVGLAVGEANGLAVGDAKGLAVGDAKGLAVSSPMGAFVRLANTSIVGILDGVKLGSAEGWCSREG